MICLARRWNQRLFGQHFFGGLLDGLSDRWVAKGWLDKWLIVLLVDWRNRNSHVSICLISEPSLSCNVTWGSDMNPTLAWPHINLCLDQALSAGLTREQKYTVDRMVEAYRLYRAQDSNYPRVGSRKTHRLHPHKHLDSIHVALMCFFCLCLPSCLSGPVQKMGRAWLMLHHQTCNDYYSLPEQCLVRCDLVICCLVTIFGPLRTTCNYFGDPLTF